VSKTKINSNNISAGGKAVKIHRYGKSPYDHNTSNPRTVEHASIELQSNIQLKRMKPVTKVEIKLSDLKAISKKESGRKYGWKDFRRKMREPASLLYESKKESKPTELPRSRRAYVHEAIKAFKQVGCGLCWFNKRDQTIYTVLPGALGVAHVLKHIVVIEDENGNVVDWKFIKDASEQELDRYFNHK